MGVQGRVKRKVWLGRRLGAAQPSLAHLDALDAVLVHVSKLATATSRGAKQRKSSDHVFVSGIGVVMIDLGTPRKTFPAKVLALPWVCPRGTKESSRRTFSLMNGSSVVTSGRAVRRSSKLLCRKEPFSCFPRMSKRGRHGV